MASKDSKIGQRPKGFFASLGLAVRIARGGLSLLVKYPIVVVPLLLVYILVLSAAFSLFFISSSILAYSVIFVVAYSLMFSFAISSQLLLQIHHGRKPSLILAFGAPGTRRMIPNVLKLSVVWYILVAILVAIETVIRGLLDRISDDLADVVIESVMGTFAAALRMAGFMMVAIMTFEEISFSASFARLREIVRESPISAVGGLVLTKMVGFLIFAAFFILSGTIGTSDQSLLAFGLTMLAMALAWVLAMFLEQIFVTGLYLYHTFPDSPLVELILAGQLGRELPEPTYPELSEQPAI